MTALTKRAAASHSGPRRAGSRKPRLSRRVVAILFLLPALVMLTVLRLAPVSVLTMTQPELFEFSKPAMINIGSGTDEGVSAAAAGGGSAHITLGLAADDAARAIVERIVAACQGSVDRRERPIHADQIEELEVDGVPSVRFVIHPWQGTDLDEVVVQLPLVDRRVVRSSNGQAEERLVVPMTLRLLGHDLATEVTLSNRDQMGFRLLIGREALRSRIVVDSGHSYLGPRPPRAIRRRNRGR